MKKLIALLLALAMVLAMTACGKKEEPEVLDGPGTAVANPMVEYDSLEALNDAYGIKLTHPGVMGVTDESFVAIEGGDYDIAQYKFTVAGTEYTLRCAPTDEDISGVYVNGGTLFGNITGEANVATEDYLGARWFTLDGQYCLTASSENLDSGVFSDCAEELASLTAVSNSYIPSYDEIVGSYQDSWSQRASMEVTLDGDGVQVFIGWGSSATENDEWTLHCTFGEDGLLYYTGGSHVRIDYEKNTTEEIATDLEGWFSPDENMNLLWTGASEENCVECVFEKMPQ